MASLIFGLAAYHTFPKMKQDADVRRLVDWAPTTFLTIQGNKLHPTQTEKSNVDHLSPCLLRISKKETEAEFRHPPGGPESTRYHSHGTGTQFAGNESIATEKFNKVHPFSKVNLFQTRIRPTSPKSSPDKAGKGEQTQTSHKEKEKNVQEMPKGESTRRDKNKSEPCSRWNNFLLMSAFGDTGENKFGKSSGEENPSEIHKQKLDWRAKSKTKAGTKLGMSKKKEDLDSISTSNSIGSSETFVKKNKWPVRLNSAAILRQEALYDRQVKKEQQRRINLEDNPAPLLPWQKELQDKFKKTEYRRLEGRIRDTKAVITRTQRIELNKKTAQQKKEETAQMMRRYAEDMYQKEKENRNLVLQVSEGHKKQKKVQKKLQKLKQSIVKDISEHSRKLLCQTQEEAHAELLRKSEIIREIHFIETLPTIRYKTFDDKTLAGHELLVELSLAELQERLARLREEQLREQQRKRDRIMMKKLNKNQMLMEKLDTISLNKRILSETAAIRKEETKATLAFQPTVIQDKTILALQKKLEEKQLECQRLKKDEKTKTLSRQQHTRLKNTESYNKERLKKCLKDLELNLEKQIDKEVSYRHCAKKNIYLQNSFFSAA